MAFHYFNFKISWRWKLKSGCVNFMVWLVHCNRNVISCSLWAMVHSQDTAASLRWDAGPHTDRLQFKMFFSWDAVDSCRDGGLWLVSMDSCDWPEFWANNTVSLAYFLWYWMFHSYTVVLTWYSRIRYQSKIWTHWGKYIYIHTYGLWLVTGTGKINQERNHSVSVLQRTSKSKHDVYNQLVYLKGERICGKWSVNSIYWMWVLSGHSRQ